LLVGEILTVNRLGLPLKRRHSLACTNSTENMIRTVRLVSRSEAVAKCGDGRCAGRRWHNGSRQRLPSIESLQALASS
jgi:hypothetical protein